MEINNRDPSKRTLKARKGSIEGEPENTALKDRGTGWRNLFKKELQTRSGKY